MTTRLGDSLLTIYSDASSVQGGTGIRVGLAAFDYAQGAREVFSRTLNIGKGQIVYNSELEGITQAFEYAARVALPLQEIRVHADNQIVIYRLQTSSDKPGQAWQLRCIKAANQVVSKGANISIHWIPGHKDVVGNERADILAKAAAKKTPSTHTTSLAMTGIRIKALAHQEWQQVLTRYTPLATKAPMLPSIAGESARSSVYLWRLGGKLPVPSTSSSLAMATTKHTSSALAKQTAPAVAVEPYRSQNTFFSAANG
jgi:ribonuclease HI